MKDASRSEFRAVSLIVVMVLAYLTVVKFLHKSEVQPPLVQVIDTPQATPSQEPRKSDIFKPPATSKKKPSRSKAPDRSSRDHSIKKKYSSKPQFTHCAPFNPNTVSTDSLIAWGLPQRVAHNLHKYRDKGGQFYAVADVGKIYGMDSITIKRLQSCMQFDQPQRQPKQAVASLCINGASVEKWEQLYGIGPVLAERIVRFREALGGFIDIGQVADTYGLPPETFGAIRNHLSIGQTHHRLSINSTTTEALSIHPYLSHREARSIMSYIRNHGALTSSESLYNIHILTSEKIEQIAPYLDFSLEDVVMVSE